MLPRHRKTNKPVRQAFRISRSVFKFSPRSLTRRYRFWVFRSPPPVGKYTTDIWNLSSGYNLVNMLCNLEAGEAGQVPAKNRKDLEA